MAVPNLKPIVQRVRDSRVWDFRTKEGLCAYSGAVVLALHREDPNFKHLKKRAPKNGCYPPGSNEGRAVDAALYVPTGQAVDFIGSAGFHPTDPPPNPVAWSTADPVGKYDADDGFDPVEDDTPDPPPGPVDPPNTNDFEARILTILSEMDMAIINVLDRIEAYRVRMEAINDAWKLADTQNVKKGAAAVRVAEHVHSARLSRFGPTVKTGGPE